MGIVMFFTKSLKSLLFLLLSVSLLAMKPAASVQQTAAAAADEPVGNVR